MREEAKTKSLAVVDRTALFFFAVLVFFLPIAGAVVESSFGFIFLCFIIKAVVEGPSREKIKRFFSDRINLSLLIFYIAIGVSMFAAGPFWLRSFKAWFYKWGEGVLLFYFAQIFLNRKRLMVLLWVFIASGFLVAVDGIYQWVTGVDFILGFEPITVGNMFTAVRATFNHYNDFATYLVVIFFVAAGFLSRTKKIFTAFILAFLALLATTDLFLTHSRGAWLALLASICLSLFFIPSRKIKIAIVCGFIAAMVILLCLPQGLGLLREFLVRADAGRFEFWKAAFTLFKQSPLIGTGLGLFMERMSGYSFGAVYAHNCYVQIAAETGLLGLLPFLWFIGEVVFKALRVVKSRFDFFSLALLCAWFAFLIHMFFDTQLYSLKLSILFWLFTALVSQYFYWEREVI